MTRYFIFFSLFIIYSETFGVDQCDLMANQELSSKLKNITKDGEITEAELSDFERILNETSRRANEPQVTVVRPRVEEIRSEVQSLEEKLEKMSSYNSSPYDRYILKQKIAEKNKQIENLEIEQVREANPNLLDDILNRPVGTSNREPSGVSEAIEIEGTPLEDLFPSLKQGDEVEATAEVKLDLPVHRNPTPEEMDEIYANTQELMSRPINSGRNGDYQEFINSILDNMDDKVEAREIYTKMDKMFKQDPVGAIIDPEYIKLGARFDELTFPYRDFTPNEMERFYALQEIDPNKLKLNDREQKYIKELEKMVQRKTMEGTTHPGYKEAQRLLDEARTIPERAYKRGIEESKNKLKELGTRSSKRFSFKDGKKPKDLTSKVEDLLVNTKHYQAEDLARSNFSTTIGGDSDIDMIKKFYNSQLPPGPNLNARVRKLHERLELEGNEDLRYLVLRAEALVDMRTTIQASDF